MTDDHRAAPGENGAPVPRDMPDQQAQGDEDPWEAADRTAMARAARSEPDAGDDVPDTDEAGTGPGGGSPSAGAVHPEEQPEPEEPSG
ncbi:hypothetical protein [Streptomyces similanensis]|uniref:Uncharacterized protein n=1 Tax=Streptomyces similanensis TaxID=1274988 RepID=A0ABP9KQQ3_9ACTN